MTSMTSALCNDDSMSEWTAAPPNYVGRRLTECCNWAAPVADCEWQNFTDYDGYIGGILWRCAPARGCHVRPGLKRTAHLRSYEPAE